MQQDTQLLEGNRSLSLSKYIYIHTYICYVFLLDYGILHSRVGRRVITALKLVENASSRDFYYFLEFLLLLNLITLPSEQCA